MAEIVKTCGETAEKSRHEKKLAEKAKIELDKAQTEIDDSDGPEVKAENE